MEVRCVIPHSSEEIESRNESTISSYLKIEDYPDNFQELLKDHETLILKYSLGNKTIRAYSRGRNRYHFKLYKNGKFKKTWK